MSPLARLREQRGTTLVELLVAISAGTVVFAGLTMVVTGSLHQTTRITDRVHATQEARTAVHRLTVELHSACVAPQIAPVREGSTGSSLSFVHKAGAEVAPKPTLSTVTLSGGTLTQADYAWESGSAPDWTFETTPTTRTLLTRVSAPSGSVPVFRYYEYSNGQIATPPLETPLDSENAARAAQVDVAVKVSPPGRPVTDAGGAAIVQDSALLRFTPPSYSTSAVNLPCE